MSPGDIRVFSPSRMRAAARCPTAICYPAVQMVVGESEATAYRRSGHQVCPCPDAINGNIARVRNWILDQNQDAGGIVMLDDDVRYIARWVQRTERRLTAAELEEFIERGFIMAEDAGAYLWGINMVNDKGAYREYTPLSFVAPVLGPFSAHRPSPVRYDERFSLKEDFDFSLQHLARYRRVLRFNAYFYLARHNQQVGGCAAYRTVARERAQFEALRAKWGADIVRVDTGGDKAMVRGPHTRRGYDLNPRLHIPIRGV